MGHRHGFSLVELLVVIAIVGVLVALLLPAVQMAREAARRLHCQDNLKQMALGAHAYHDVKRTFPDGGGGADGVHPNQTWSWEVHILPYIEEGNLHSRFDFQQVYFAAYNLPAIRTFVGTYHCPSAPPADLITCCISISGEKDTANTDYLAVGTHRQVPQAIDPFGSGVMFSVSHVKLREITDGTSKTLLVCESQVLPGDPFPQQYPSYCPSGNCVLGFQWFAYAVATTFNGINSGGTRDEQSIQCYHPQIANFAFADGHVAALSDETSRSVLNALTTRNGGEVSHGEY